MLYRLGKGSRNNSMEGFSAIRILRVERKKVYRKILRIPFFNTIHYPYYRGLDRKKKAHLNLPCLGCSFSLDPPRQATIQWEKFEPKSHEACPFASQRQAWHVIFCWTGKRLGMGDSYVGVSQSWRGIIMSPLSLSLTLCTCVSSVSSAGERDLLTTWRQGAVRSLAGTLFHEERDGHWL